MLFKYISRQLTWLRDDLSSGTKMKWINSVLSQISKWLVIYVMHFIQQPLKVVHCQCLKVVSCMMLWVRPLWTCATPSCSRNTIMWYKCWPTQSNRYKLMILKWFHRNMIFYEKKNKFCEKVWKWRGKKIKKIFGLSEIVNV